MTQQPNTPDFSSIVDEVLEHYREYVAGVYQGIADYDQAVAKQTLLDAVWELTSMTIGKNDRDYSHDNADQESLKILVATSTACNELRAEQRTRRNTLLGKKEN